MDGTFHFSERVQFMENLIKETKSKTNIIFEKILKPS